MKSYLIELPYFDGKQLHPAGSVITVGDHVIPSVTWRDPDTRALVKPQKAEHLVLSDEERALVLEHREKAARAAAKPVTPAAPAEPAKHAAGKRTAEKDAL